VSIIGISKERLKPVELLSFSAVIFALTLLVIPSAYPAQSQEPFVQNRAMRLAVDDQDQPWAVWEVVSLHDVDVYYSQRTDDGWQPARPLGADPGVLEYSPSLAFSADGSTAWAAWSASTGTDQASIIVRQWVGDAWSDPVPVPGTKVLRGDEPFLAAGPDGGLWLAWVGHDGTDREVYVSRWDGASWSEPQRVGRDDTDPMAYDTHPRLAVDDTGQVWVVWASYEGSLDDQIHASYWDGTGWSPQVQISAIDETPDSWPSVALDADGQPWVAWNGATAEQGGRSRIYISHWDRDNSVWSAEELVSSLSGSELDERQPSLAFDADGQLHLSWTVSGALSGIAHRVWDGTSATATSWAETETPVESQVFATDGEPSLFWLVPDDGGLAPMEQQSTDEMSSSLPEARPPRTTGPESVSSAVPNRHLAHGDSITWGGYQDVDGTPATPYPVFLELILDSNVIQSEVINHGKPGEKARAAEARLREGMLLYNPEFVQIMEGTNDLSSDYSPADTAHHVRLLVQAIKADFSGSRVMIATLTPRQDNRNDEVAATNQLLYTKVAQPERVPIADPWQAFHNYGPWSQFYVDALHPGTKGLEIIANTFYQKMVSVGWLPEDTKAPTAWITPLPAQSKCFARVEWNGDDGIGSGIANFDVQVQVGAGSWNTWLPGTPQYFGFYVGKDGQNLSFRVRARDKVGNTGEYSAASTTQVDCKSPIERIFLPALSRKASFTQ
jgi:lysophospholipase L1-like esterase